MQPRMPGISELLSLLAQAQQAVVRDATRRLREQCGDTFADVLGPALAASFAVGAGPQVAAPPGQSAALSRKDS